MARLQTVLEEWYLTCRLPAKCRTSWFGVLLLWWELVPFYETWASCVRKGNWLLPSLLQFHSLPSWLGLPKWNQIVYLFLQLQPRLSSLNCYEVDWAPTSRIQLSNQIWICLHCPLHNASGVGHTVPTLLHPPLTSRWPTCIPMEGRMVLSVLLKPSWLR